MSEHSFSYKKVTIRKPHLCYGCARIFAPPTQMFHNKYVADGEFGSIYMCLTCDQIMDYEKYCSGETEFPEFWVSDGLNRSLKETAETQLEYFKNKYPSFKPHRL